MGSAALLGLPAALFAHALLFGNEHTLAGSLHGPALEAGMLFGFLAALLAAIGAVRNRRACSPGFADIASGAAIWFSLIELCERSHEIPVLLAAAAILFASWVVRAVLLAFRRTIVAIAAILHEALSPHGVGIVTARSAQPIAQSFAIRFRLFSRPPPVFA